MFGVSICLLIATIAAILIFVMMGDKLHSIKTLEDFMSEKILLIDGHSILNRAFYWSCRILQIQKENTQGQYMVS